MQSSLDHFVSAEATASPPSSAASSFARPEPESVKSIPSTSPASPRAIAAAMLPDPANPTIIWRRLTVPRKIRSGASPARGVIFFALTTQRVPLRPQRKSQRAGEVPDRIIPARTYPPNTSNRSVWSFVPSTSSDPGPLPHTGTTAPVCCWLGGAATGAAPGPP